MRYDNLRRIAAEARAAFSTAYPELDWAPEQPDQQFNDPETDHKMVRLCLSSATGPLLRAADIDRCADALNSVLVENSFPQQNVTGSSWGELVCTARRSRDGAILEWRGRSGMQLWLEAPVD